MTERPDEIARVVGMLRVVWRDALHLRRSREAWQALRPSLGEYQGAGHMLFSWYRDAMLAGCRRLVDARSDVSSLTAALKLLARHASKVTEELVVSTSVARHEEAWTAAGDAHEARRALIDVVTGAGSQYEGCLTKAAVQADLDRLEDAAQDIRALTNEIVTHRAARPTEALVVTENDIDRLIDLVLEVAQRWTRLLDGVHISTHAPRVSGIRPVATALHLFDWKAYVNAESAAKYRLGPGASPEDYQRIRDGAQLRYWFPGDG